jgi:chromosome segregation ATPase
MARETLASLKRKIEELQSQLRDRQARARDLETQLRDAQEGLTGPSPLLDNIREQLDIEPNGNEEGADILYSLRKIREALGLDGLNGRIDDAIIEAKDAADECAGAKEDRDMFERQMMDAEAALTLAREDRTKLLRRLCLTDFEWSSMGGACESDLEV